MSREQVMGPQARDAQAGELEGASERASLPPEVDARVRMMGPQDAEALGELLRAHPQLAQQILAVASPRMGISATKRAIALAETAGQPEAAGHQMTALEQIDAIEEDRPVMSEAQIANARSYNRQHARYAAQFNAATDRQMLGATGELDPIAVWRWQEAHGLSSDGCVGPASAAAAKREAKAAKQPEAQAPEAAPAPEAAATAEAPVTTAAPATEAPATTAALATESATAPVEPVQTAAPATDNAMRAGGSAEATAAPAPVVPARADDGGIGSQARRSLANGSAVEAFKLLTNDNDRVLTANLADYGDLNEQRALLDAVIDQADDVTLIKVAFHAYWHVEVGGLDARNAAQSWPVPVLRSIHHELKVLPDKDARAGAWQKLTLKNTAPREQGRGWWGGHDFSITGDANGWGNATWKEGYTTGLTAPVTARATELQVTEAGRFKVGDKLALRDKNANREIVTVTAISGNTYTLAAPTQRAHDADVTIELNNAMGERQVNWLDYTVRHEIAHSLDGGAVDGHGFYALGGWNAQNPYSLDVWVNELGGASARQGNGISIPDEMPKGTPENQDRAWWVVKMALDEAVTQNAHSIFDVKPALLPYKGKGIPVIDAIEAALGAGRAFYNTPTSLYAANGRRFSINFEQHQIQAHSETMLNDRVTNYSVAAPAEFFAETYAVFYEEAGKPDVTDADYGRLIRNESWRVWMREHVHNRGHAPAGTGAAKLPGDHAGGEAEIEAGAHNEGAKRGKKTSESGL